MPQSPSRQNAGNRDTASDPNVSTSPPQPSASKPISPKPSPPSPPAATPDVQFRPRKRSRKLRPKLPTKEATPVDSDSELALTRSELHLLKQAQLLREQTHSTALDTRFSQPVPRASDNPNANDVAQGEDVIGGLNESFAVERSGVAIEERMGQYIEEGMKRKFGSLGYGAKINEDGNRNDENELYAVPERLQVSQRPMYDPGEGMPAAGVEEVEISAEGRQQNIRDTIRAHRELVTKGARQEEDGRVVRGGGNVSANFLQHRRDLIEQHVMAKGGKEAGDNEAGGGMGRKGRGHKLASDGLAVERFRKRWRR